MTDIDPNHDDNSAYSDEYAGSTDTNDAAESDFTGQAEATTDLWQGMEIRQRKDQDEEGTDESTAALSADDAGADADLPRASRAEKQKMRRRTQLSTVLPALLLMAAGVYVLVNPDQMSGPTLGLGVVALIAVLILLRFMFNARRERGLFFLLMTAVLIAAYFGMVITNTVEISYTWPMLIMAPGAALIITFLFERTHERGLILPGLIFLAAGGAILPFTTGNFDTGILSGVALYWPFLLLLLALAILPRAIRDRAE